MNRSITSMANKVTQHPRPLVLPYRRRMPQILKPPCDVFINHRGIETKRSIAGLLHHYLRFHNLHSFLDYKTLMPGERLSDEIKLSIHQCKVGITIFSPQYCDSWYCLYELALLMKTGKRLVPIFWDVYPSQLTVPGCFPARHVKIFGKAIDKARDTVGITFNSSTGDWSNLLMDTCGAVRRILVELDERNGRGHTSGSQLQASRI